MLGPTRKMVCKSLVYSAYGMVYLSLVRGEDVDLLPHEDTGEVCRRLNHAWWRGSGNPRCEWRYRISWGACGPPLKKPLQAHEAVAVAVAVAVASVAVASVAVAVPVAVAVRRKARRCKHGGKKHKKQ